MQLYCQIVLLWNQTCSRDAAEGGRGSLHPGQPRLGCFILLFYGSLILVPEQRQTRRPGPAGIPTEQYHWRIFSPRYRDYAVLRK